LAVEKSKAFFLQSAVIFLSIFQSFFLSISFQKNLCEADHRFEFCSMYLDWQGLGWTLWLL